MMNEHIMDALVQADKYAWKKAGKKYDAVGDLNWKWEDAKNEKFAELLIRECMNICKAHPSRTVSNNWNADAVAPDIVNRISEHFEVDE